MIFYQKIKIVISNKNVDLVKNQIFNGNKRQVINVQMLELNF